MIKLANKVIGILKVEGQEEILMSAVDSESRRIPFIHDFPKGACEITSYIYAKLLHEQMPCKDIKLVSGSYDGESHYWVNVNDLVYDLTFDQFKEVDEPLFEAATDSITNLKASTVSDIEGAFSEWDQVHKDSWLLFVRSKL